MCGVKWKIHSKVLSTVNVKKVTIFKTHLIFLIVIVEIYIFHINPSKIVRICNRIWLTIQQFCIWAIGNGLLQNFDGFTTGSLTKVTSASPKW